MKRPRKVKKRIKNNGILIYDLATIPNGMNLERIYRDFHYNRIVVWSSSSAMNLSNKNITNPPTVINGIKKIKIIDISNEHSRKS